VYVSVVKVIIIIIIVIIIIIIVIIIITTKGKLSEAEVIYKQCLDKQKVVLGESHPETLNTARNLAIIHAQLAKN